MSEKKNKTNKCKTGRYSEKDKAFLEDSIHVMTWQEMADVLGRDVESVRRMCKQLGLTRDHEYKEIKEMNFNLRDRRYFQELKQQFTDGELVLFEYHWNRIIAQFSGDVLATEETQIIDTIKLEIMMNRNAVQQKTIIENMSRIEQSIIDEKDNANRPGTVLELETVLASMSSGHGALVREYRELQEKKDKMLKSIRGDRAERVSVATGRMNFLSLIKELTGNAELRRDLGLKMEKRRLAMEEARKRLSEYHTYVDGHVDQPLLTSDTVKEDNDVLFMPGENS